MTISTQLPPNHFLSCPIHDLRVRAIIHSGGRKRTRLRGGVSEGWRQYSEALQGAYMATPSICGERSEGHYLWLALQGYLSHKKTSTLLGPPWDPLGIGLQ